MIVERVRKIRVRRISLADGTHLKDAYGAENCPVIRSAEDIANLFEELLGNEHESMIAGALDGDRLICWNLVWRQTDLFSPFAVDVFSGAIHHGGTSLILVHNKKRSSQSDFGLVSRIAEAGMLLGIPLLDSVVLSEDGYWSDFALENLQQQVPEKSIRRVKGSVLSPSAPGKSWRCNYCLRESSVPTCPGILPIDRKICLPTRCSDCQRLSWLTSE